MNAGPASPVSHGVAPSARTGRTRPVGGWFRRTAFGRARVLALGILGGVLLPRSAGAIGQQRFVEFAPAPGDFPIAASGSVASIYVDSRDFPGVIRAAGDLQADLARVTGITPAVIHEPPPAGSGAIVVGTIGRSRWIDALIHGGRFNPAPVAGQWEAFVTELVPRRPPQGGNAW